MSTVTWYRHTAFWLNCICNVSIDFVQNSIPIIVTVSLIKTKIGDFRRRSQIWKNWEKFKFGWQVTNSELCLHWKWNPGQTLSLSVQHCWQICIQHKLQIQFKIKFIKYLYEKISYPEWICLFQTKMTKMIFCPNVSQQCISQVFPDCSRQLFFPPLQLPVCGCREMLVLQGGAGTAGRICRVSCTHFCIGGQTPKLIYMMILIPPPSYGMVLQSKNPSMLGTYYTLY